MTYLCIKPACGPDCSDCNCAISPVEQMRYAVNYAFLRAQSLDSVECGGVFVGKTPDNVVLNGEDLDLAVRAAMKATT